MSDVFEAVVGTDLQGAFGDDDLDSYTNLEEFFAGANPLDAEDFPSGLNFEFLAGDILEIEWETRPGLNYQLQRLDFALQSTGEWVNEGNAVTAVADTHSALWNDFEVTDIGLFRIGGIAVIDFDEDGLDLWEEIQLG